MHAGLYEVVEASIVGSILGNILLVLGAAMLAGGLRHPEQHFNAAGARSQATMLTLAAIALILPAAFETVAGTSEHLDRVSFSISVILLLVYSLYLAFALITHPALFTSSDVPESAKVQVSPARPGLLAPAAQPVFSYASTPHKWHNIDSSLKDRFTLLAAP